MGESGGHAEDAPIRSARHCLAPGQLGFWHMAALGEDERLRGESLMCMHLWGRGSCVLVCLPACLWREPSSAHTHHVSPDFLHYSPIFLSTSQCFLVQPLRSTSLRECLDSLFWLIPYEIPVLSHLLPQSSSSSFFPKFQNSTYFCFQFFRLTSSLAQTVDSVEILHTSSNSWPTHERTFLMICWL